MNALTRFRNKAQRGFSTVAALLAVAAVSLLGTGIAAASPGTTAAAAITGAAGDVTAVQGAMIGVLVLLVVFALIRRSMGK